MRCKQRSNISLENIISKIIFNGVKKTERAYIGDQPYPIMLISGPVSRSNKKRKSYFQTPIENKKTK